MAEQGRTMKIAMVVVLAVILAIVLVVRTGVLPIGSGGAGGASPEAGKTGPSAVGGRGVASAGPQVQWTRPQPIGPVVNDPMRLAVPGAKAEPVRAAGAGEVEPQFRVAGIIFSTEQPSSIIIDGSILHEGDTIHGATVARITETYAELWQGDKKWQIRAGQSNKEPQ